MSWRVVLLSLTGVGLAFLLIYYAQDLSRFIVTSIWQDAVEAEGRPVKSGLISVTEIDGPVFFRTDLLQEYEPLRKNQLPFDLHIQNQIKTERDGRLTLKTKSGYVLAVEPESQLMIEERTDGSGKRFTQLYVLRGKIKPVKSGQRGTLYITQDEKSGFVIDPSSTRASGLTKDAPKPEATSAETAALPEMPEKAPETNKRGQKMPTKPSDDPSTLSNQYIEEVFSSRAQLFRRCQLTSLRDGKLSSGSYLFSLVIGPSGNIDKVRTLQTDITNKPLEACLISVIERTRFKPFSGRAISLSYPLNFQ